MSVQWGVGDLLAVTKLAWDLYHNCFLVAKEAPDEFRQLVDQLASLQGVLRTLRDDVNSDKSFLDNLGEHRKETLERCLASCNGTLRKLQDLVRKYRELGVGDGLRFWKRLKWVGKQGEISELKSKIMLHTCNISLCMSSIGNSSLARIETSVSMIRALEIQEAEQETEQEARDSIDELPLLTHARSAPAENNDVESLGPKGMSRQFTGTTLVPYTPESTPSMSEEDGTESSTNIPITPKTRNTSTPSSKTRRPSNLSIDRGVKGSSQTNQEDGHYDMPKRLGTDRSNSKMGELSTKGWTPDISEVVAGAMEELSRIRQRERATRPLRIVPQDAVHRPEEALKARFHELANEELEIRRLNAKDWLRVATWWLLKTKFNRRSFERPHSPNARGSFSPSSDSRASVNQAYVDLLKASWILYDVILKEDNIAPLLTDENKKLFYNLSDGIKEEIDSFSPVDIPDKEALKSQNLNIWELLQPQEENYDDDNLLPGLENGRWLTVEQEDAGEENETVHFRTFVNAVIGGRRRGWKSKGAPYMLILSTKEGESEPKVTICNQSGSLGVTRDFTIEDLQEHSPPTSPTLGMEYGGGVDPIQLDFDKISISVTFTNDNDLHSFMRLPAAYFNAVKRREPRQLVKATETLLFKSSVDIFEELNPSTMKPQSPRRSWKSCDLRVLETTCKEGWRTTRRLVLTSSAGERRPFCREFFLPLSRVQITRDGVERQATVKWSDCSHEKSDRTDGNYNKIYSYVYDDNNPNIALSLLFGKTTDATEFEETILHLSLPPVYAWSNGVRSRYVYDITDTEPNFKNYKACLLQHSHSNWKYSELFYMYRDTDYQYDRSALRIRFPQVYYIDYISTHVDKLYKPPSDQKPHFSHCEKRLNNAPIDFDDKSASEAFISSLTAGHELIFSRRAHSITTRAPSRLKSSKSNKGNAEVQLWRKGNFIRLVSRWDDRVEDKWMSMVIPRAGLNHTKYDNRASLPEVEYDRGRVIDMANMVARNPREKAEGKRTGPITIAFELVRDREEFAAALEGTEPPKTKNALDDLLSM